MRWRLLFRKNAVRVSTVLAIVVPVVAGVGSAEATPVALAPTDGKLVFVAAPAGAAGLYLVDTGGSVPAPLGRNPIAGSEPRWSPDGENLVFVSDRDGNPELYETDANGTTERRLTANGVADLHPSWSTGGSAVAFQRGVGVRAEIYARDSDTGTERRLTRNGVADYDPAAAPGVRWLVFGRAGDLYRMTFAGTSVARVTSGRGVDAQPAWGRSGRIVFVRRNGPESDLYSLLPSGRGEIRLTTTPGRSESNPAWSPAGDRIVFRACTAEAAPPACQLYLVNADGTGEHPLGRSGSLDGAEPDWQPLPAERKWDAAADFRTSPDQTNPGPDSWGDSTWSYLYSEGLAHDPATYRPLPQYVVVDGNREQWQAPAFVNLLIGFARDQQRLVLHSWGGRVINFGRSAILAWQSPVDGNVTITGSISLPSLSVCAVGSGTLWSIDKGPTTLQGGFLAAGGASGFDASTYVQRGDSLFFIHDPGVDSDCDAGLLRLTITAP